MSFRIEKNVFFLHLVKVNAISCIKIRPSHLINTYSCCHVNFILTAACFSD